MNQKQASEKLANTLRATNEEKITLQELVGAVQNETERLKEIKEAKNSISVRVDNGKKTIEKLEEEIEIKKNKVSSLTILIKTSLERFNELKTEQDERVKEYNKDINELQNTEGKLECDILELDMKIKKLEEKLEDKENKYSNKINMLTSKEIDIEKNIKDGEKRIKELVKEEKEAKDKTIVSVNDIEIKEEAVKELKIELGDLEQARKERKVEVKELEKETEKAKAEKEKAVAELKEEQAKAIALIQREKLVNLKAKEVKELYKGIGQDITI